MSTSFRISSPELHTMELISRRHGRTLHKLVHQPTGTLLALKSVPIIEADQLLVDYTQMSREFELLLEFDHPNVVKCHDLVVDHEDEYKILLEFMEGGSLAGKHIPDCTQLAGVARQVLQGMAYLHGRGVPHWDINPSNLLTDSVGEGQVVKIADFGHSRYFTTIRDHGDLMETVSYLCPERINVELNGASAGVDKGFPGDVWGLGMTVLEAYMGRYPIGEAGVPARQRECIALMRTICGAAPPAAPPFAPTELADFISCCLRKEPEMRWSAEELLKHPFVTAASAAAGDDDDDDDVPNHA